jgi:transposase InsO family protein
VWALPSKLSTRVAEAFLGVMTRYGACAKLLTDNGQEFAGELDVLCQKLLITHRTTSRYHPQSNCNGRTRYRCSSANHVRKPWLSPSAHLTGLLVESASL